MGEKCKHQRFQFKFAGIFNQPLQDFPVTDMNSVKSTNSYYGGMFFIEIGDALDCFHVNKKIKKAYI